MGIVNNLPMVRVPVLMVLALLCSAAFAAAQTTIAPAKWSTPRTPDGQPDLQGVWTNATLTPLERPASMAGRAFLTEEEAGAIEKRTADNRAATDKMGPLDAGSYNRFWFDDGTTVLSTRQTSMVVDPPDGRVPVKPSAEARRDDYAARSGDSYEFMSPWDRCITRGIPGAILPAGYNNAYQIIQTPGYFTIVYEMIHDARIIPLDSKQPRSSRDQTWMGDARGHWDGDTLVVETTNFNNKGWIATSAAGGRIKGIPHTDKLRVVERFTRVSADQISYSATIEDPDIYTRAWTVSFPLTADPEYRIFEYACHEGNYAIENILRGARAMEKPKK
jgi:hypothetical protein